MRQYLRRRPVPCAAGRRAPAPPRGSRGPAVRRLPEVLLARPSLPAAARAAGGETELVRLSGALDLPAPVLVVGGGRSPSVRDGLVDTVARVTVVTPRSRASHAACDRFPLTWWPRAYAGATCGLISSCRDRRRRVNARWPPGPGPCALVNCADPWRCDSSCPPSSAGALSRRRLHRRREPIMALVREETGPLAETAAPGQVSPARRLVRARACRSAPTAGAPRANRAAWPSRGGTRC